MLDPKVRAHALRIHMLNTAQQAFLDWIAAQQDNLLNSYSDLAWHQVMAELDDQDRHELRTAISRAVTPADYARIETLIELLGEFAQLPSEDRSHLAVARGFLLDALIALRRGDTQTAWLAAERGREKLNWLLNVRKRGSDARFRRVDEQVMSQLAASLKIYERVVSRLGEVRANG